MKKTELGSRRYIGCKAKLADWIMSVIRNNTEEATSFCDIFAGTGVISDRALKTDLYEEVIINDFLISNNVIYKAFFADEAWEEKRIADLLCQYNNIEDDDIQDNWFSRNYGGKYFSENIAKRIGHVRELIENERNNLTEKEYCILLASLIYSIDRLANTVGHFDSYIKKTIIERKLNINMINARRFSGVRIYREDANKLARKISADIIYVDPPYNSRQYSRFYHVYETLIKWDKPKLYGVAMKPKSTNMSEYCKVGALNVFEDLVENLNTKYIIVSYNNTYKSKSHSSENKIKLEEIADVMNKIGETKIFNRAYNAFNAGKTDIKGHKEYLFLTKINKNKNK